MADDLGQHLGRKYYAEVGLWMAVSEDVCTECSKSSAQPPVGGSLCGTDEGGTLWQVSVVVLAIATRARLRHSVRGNTVAVLER